ncbi:hypothetical protein MMC25_005563 [Agyrium rufum]|nr:hypothetical protein [Agyrium rufum]
MTSFNTQRTLMQRSNVSRTNRPIASHRWKATPQRAVRPKTTTFRHGGDNDWYAREGADREATRLDAKRWTKQFALTLMKREKRERAEKERQSALLAKALAEPMKNAMLVDTLDDVRYLVDLVRSLVTPTLYVDAEGENLSRDGSLTILQIHIDSTCGGIESTTFVVDVQVLGTAAFLTCGKTNTESNLKNIFEDALIPKILWDCRMDSDALFKHFKIALNGVLDLQLLEVASRFHSMYKLSGYGKCVEEHAGLSWQDCQVMSAARAIKDRFIPSKGGSWDFLTHKQMHPEMFRYCAGDVQYMPALYKRYSKMINDKGVCAEGFYLDEEAHFFAPGHENVWITRIVEESAARIQQSMSDDGWDRSDWRAMTKSPWPFR